MIRRNSISDSNSDSDYESDNDAFVKELVSALSNNPNTKSISVKCITKRPHGNTKYFTSEEKKNKQLQKTKQNL